MNDEFVNALEQAERLYSEYLVASGQSSVDCGIDLIREPNRNAAYPVGFALDERKVHALVG